MTTRDPEDPGRRPFTEVEVIDERARKAGKLATIVAAVAGVIAIVALIVALTHDHEDKAPVNCDPATDYVCHPETATETTTTQVPSTSMSPSSVEVPVPTSSPSEVVTTTVRP